MVSVIQFKKNVFILKGLVIFFLALIFAGCATYQIVQTPTKIPPEIPTIEPVKIEKPDWIVEVPPSYFLGCATKSSSIGEGQREALRDAAEQIISAIGSRIKFEFREKIKVLNDKITKEIIDDYEAKGEAILKDLTIKKRHFEQYKISDNQYQFYDVYILVWYPEEKIEEARKTLIEFENKKINQIEDAHREAIESRKKGYVIEAISQYLVCLKLLKRWPELKESYKDKMISEISSLLTSLQLYATENYEYRNPEKQKFVVMCVIKEKDREFPAISVPVEFGFDNGSGDLDKIAVTDNKGIAESKIYRVYSSVDENKIYAKILLDEVITTSDSSQLFDEEAKVRLEKLMESKKVICLFSSVLKKAKVKTSNLKIIIYEWGKQKQSLFSVLKEIKSAAIIGNLKEFSGIGVTYDRYQIVVDCLYPFGLPNISKSKTQSFDMILPEPILLKPNGSANFLFSLDSAIISLINHLRKQYSQETIQLSCKFYGVDENGNQNCVEVSSSKISEEQWNDLKENQKN